MNDFNEFWSLYPRRVSKRTAQKAWDKEVKAGTDPAAILAGLRRQLPYLQSRDIQFIPHASTWLNQGRFEDEIQPIQRSGRRSVADAARDYLGNSSDAFGLPSLGRH